jgi:hypothetical protein
MGFFQYGQLVEQLATTATAAGTTALVNTSKQNQVFTGTSTQTVVLPNATTMSIGQFFNIYNQSSGNLTLQFNGGGTFADASGTAYGTLLPHSSIAVMLQTNGTSAGTWAVITAGMGNSLTVPKAQTFTSTGTTTGYVFTILSASPGTGSTYTNNGQTFTVVAGLSSGTQLFMTGTGAPESSGTLTYVSGSPSGNLTYTAVQVLATYTTASSPTPLYIKVRAIGGGGGGAGSGTSEQTDGVSGGNTFFGTNILVAGGGSGGEAGIEEQGASGGSASVTTSSTVLQLATLTGGSGGGCAQYSASTTSQNGGGSMGGQGAFGGGGGAAAPGSVGVSAAANTGGGGGGPGSTQTANFQGGTGGGAGGYAEMIITNPGAGATFFYAVGTGGAGGGAGVGGNDGGNGAAGLIIVEEYFQ